MYKTCPRPPVVSKTRVHPLQTAASVFNNLPLGFPYLFGSVRADDTSKVSCFTPRSNSTAVASKPFQAHARFDIRTLL